jgi:hypothetical protein
MKSAIRKCALLSLSEIPYSWRSGANRVMLLRDDPTAQIALWCAHWTVPVQRAGSGDLGSRQQINVLRRKSPKRPALNNADCLLFVWLSRLVPTTLAALAVVSPETVIRWHRAGFRAYWRSQSRPRGGRPKTSLEI